MNIASVRDRVPGAIRERLSEAVSQLAAAGALIAVFIFLALASPAFLTADNLFNVGTQTAVVALIAIGETLVIISRGIDLSVGSVAALTMVLGVMMMSNLGLPPLIAIIGGVLVGCGTGFVNGFLVSVAGLNPFIATLGMLSVARGMVLILTGAVAVFGVPNSFRLLGQGQIVGGIPIPVILLAVVALLAHIVLTRTRLGRYAYAIGSNQEAARLSGIPVRRYLIFVYIIAGALTGLGGMVAASRVASGQPNFGIGLELDVIAAAVIGGASLFGGQGTIPGTLIGAFLIALIRNGAVLLGIDTFYQQVIIGVIIWLAVFWDQYRRRKLSAEF